MVGLTCFLLLLGVFPHPTLAFGAVYKVNPSGDSTGVEDVENIRAALEAAGSGTVKLSKGDFYLADTISISGFDGTLKGVDSKSVLHAIGAIDTLFAFETLDCSKLTVEKLTFTTELESVTALEIITNGDISIKHCDFYDFEVGIATYDNIDSTIIVTQNEFYDVGHAIYLGGPYENCEIRVSHNTIDTVRHGVEVYDLVDSQVTISHNTIVGVYDSAETFQTGAAIMVCQASQFGANGLVAILFNEIQGYTRWDWGYDMVNVLDFGPLYTGEYGNLEIIIAFNRIELDESLWGGIGVHGGFTDTWIAYNEVSGSGCSAIYIAFWSLWGLESQKDAKLILNDVSDFSAVPVPGWIDPTAPIWIGPGVTESLIIAKGDPATVLDVSGSNTVIFIGHWS